VQQRIAALVLLLALVATGCSTEIQTVGRPGAPPRVPKSEDCALPVYESDSPLDASCVEVGDVFVGDTGWSTDCGIDSVREQIRKEGCLFGADAAQIVRHHEPSPMWGSTCHQVRARFVVCKQPGEPDAV
jgi:hypothetical protein